MTELKPCPFCGGEVYPMYWSKTKKFYMYHYKRNKKPCVIEVFQFNDGAECLEDTYELWNRRANDA